MKFQKGTMIWVKRILGVALLLMASGFIFDIKQIQEITMNQPIISIGVLIISGYFLLKSGNQS